MANPQNPKDKDQQQQRNPQQNPGQQQQNPGQKQGQTPGKQTYGEDEEMGGAKKSGGTTDVERDIKRDDMGKNAPRGE